MESESRNSHHYVCKCFYTDNIYLKQYDIHVSYETRAQFRKQYLALLNKKGCVSEKQFSDVCSQDEYLSPEFRELVNLCVTGNHGIDDVIQKVLSLSAERVYSFPVFTMEFCNKLIEELTNFENGECPKGRPNTMNKYGILLNELGFDEEFITPLREKFLNPIAQKLYPDWCGQMLDSHRAFVVKYKLSEDLDLGYHYDNAEVTLNVSLGKEFTGGALFFGDMRTERKKTPTYSECEHKPGTGLIHRGQHMHGALPIESGERYNLIIWMRASSVRNYLCPMCNNKPELVVVKGDGDGFTDNTNRVVNVCTVY
ncbi:hypothetical protein KUTeg_010205 [Tegillarca granosa]|uniref:Fe2OG dioxygenase domain-containing protein n=1 Tax=Tegillarca granosa TaxID=220873 RepID=A0ABQ9F640_TEGGR|nr:hypothetical protein KUTeg_010205 [Tegillarca granosa]